MLIDKRKIKLNAGNGGRGAVAFNPRTQKPDGGNGGDGGNIYFEGTTNLYDLKFIRNNQKIDAENGQDGMKNRKDGKNGEDIIIKVPLITHLKNLDEETIVSIKEEGQRELVAKGGRGGLGNHYYKRGQKLTLNKFQYGKDGEEFEVIIELNLSADILFVGFPNAGKSSMLNSLTNANVKVAAYPFTTLEPHLGVAKDMILMDLPGFIEGTKEGKGLGTRFTKHMLQGKLIAHFISLENEDVLSAYNKMRKEIENMHPKLAEKPEIIILSKSDMFDENIISEKKKILQKKNKNIFVTSSFDYDKMGELTEKFEETIEKIKK